MRTVAKAPKKPGGPGFGDRLRELRLKKGLTVTELAELSGMTQPTISRLETGGRSPSWETVIRLAEALGVPTDSFRPPEGDADGAT